MQVIGVTRSVAVGRDEDHGGVDGVVSLAEHGGADGELLADDGLGRPRRPRRRAG